MSGEHGDAKEMEWGNGGTMEWGMVEWWKNEKRKGNMDRLIV
jgi:hypothetical protein